MPDPPNPILSVPAGGTGTISAQHWSMQQSLERFMEIFADDPHVYRFGQFAWLRKLKVSIEKKWNTNANTGVLRDVLNRPSPHPLEITNPSLTLESNFMRALNRDDKTYKTANEDIQIALHPNPGGEAGAAALILSAMLTGGSAKDASTIYSACSQKFDRLELFGSGPFFDTHFRSPSNLMWATLRAMYPLSSEECFNFEGQVIQFINNPANKAVPTRRFGSQGFKGARLSSAPPLSLRIYSKVTRASQLNDSAGVPLPTALGELLQYDARLPSIAGPGGTMQRCLDAGYMIKAGVVSGFEHDKNLLDGSVDPDHYVLIIGYDNESDGTKYLFWDPDSIAAFCRVVNVPDGKQGFGTFCYVGPGENIGFELSKYHALGRLATGTKRDETMHCTDGKGGHFDYVELKADDGKDRGYKLKRYQVVLLQRV
jgi:hypothetical protein